MNRQGRQTGRTRRRRGGRRRWLLLGVLVCVLAAGLGLAWPFWRLSEQFAGRRERVPSRLYGLATHLALGAAVDRAALVAELEAQGYRKSGERRLPPGRFASVEAGLAVHLRAHPTPQGLAPGGLLEARLDGRWVSDLRLRGKTVEEADLTPPLLASYFGPRLEDRWPVELDELPEELIRAVLAAEDASFFDHAGLSPSGIARALWVNLRGGEIRQGGSTLTQQLVKNLYFTQERTWPRKIQEAVVALLLEARYDKRAILRAYLNEIYWGRSGAVELMGVGAASRAYFGKEPRELTVSESALLAGIIRSPGSYSPVTSPEKARQRRDWVLERMGELGWLSAEAVAAAQKVPLPPPRHRLVARQAPYFAELAAAEARRRFSLPALEDAGYVLLSTLCQSDQQRAETAVTEELAKLEKSWQKGHKGGPLQAALVSIEPRSGEILAYVGGRDYGASQFDRASQARRQAGSAFKPVVYAAAMEAGVVAPSSLVEDAPLTVTQAGRSWSPSNDDASFRGWVSVRTALEKSINVPTARVALAVGLPRIVELARNLGITTPLEPYPSLALGAFEVTPLELATVYATFAAAGQRPDVHGLAAVLRPDLRPVVGGAPLAPRRVLSAQGTYLLTATLVGVLERGTGRAARAAGVTDPLAGKTGTTNDRRDSWFAGYAPDRVSLVWVGYDDNSSTRLSGSRAALPIWSRFTAAVRPAGGYPSFPQPPGVVTAAIDPVSGELASDDCPEAVTEVFLEGRVPAAICHLHGSWLERRIRRTDEPAPSDDDHPIRRWLRRVLKRKKPGDGG